jgi:hypothetical protein
MSVPGGMMESLAMLQSALTAATPEVTMPEVVGTVQNPMQMAGMSSAMGGSGSARAGAAAADLLGGMAQPRRGRGGGIAPTKNELELALLGGNLPTTPEQYEARDQYVEAAAQYENSRTSRFGRTNLGKMESLYDLFRGKGARKDMVEARNNLHQVNEARAIEHQQSMVAKEMERREKYVNDVRPLLAYTNPNLPHQALEGLAVQAAAQNMPIEKLLPEGAPQPVAEEYLGPSGETMVRFRNPVNGAIMTSENYKPYIKKAPTGKPTDTTWVTQTMEDGSTVKVQYASQPGPDGEYPMIGQPIPITPPTPEGEDLKTMASMGGEQRKMLGLTTSAGKLYAQAVPLLLSSNGEFDNLTPFKYGSEARAAYKDMWSGVFDLLRAETGAAITDSEVERDVDRYVPTATDSDVTARAKLRRLWMKIDTQHTASTSGYKEIPPELGLPDVNSITWAVDQLAPEAVEQEMAKLDLDEQYEKAMRKARAAAGEG